MPGGRAESRCRDPGRGAGRLAAALLDRRILAHGRPALEDRHPPLAAARRLAQDIGMPVADVADHDWGDE